jgi:hypothetical protein
MNFIPRWFFEFPGKFYAEANEDRNNLRQASLVKTPPLNECDLNPIPAYLSCGMDLPEIWEADLLNWQVNFYNRIKPRKLKNISMPVLFLALLTHFLEAVKREEALEEYSPYLYRELIYSSSDIDKQMPLGVYDQLNTINDFIETLSILWDHRESTNLNEFSLFKFNGVGLLQGKRRSQDKYETILAYCGGFVESMGKCGNSPLIVGAHENCGECGKLICDICGYCSSDRYCSKCEERMKKATEWRN